MSQCRRRQPYTPRRGRLDLGRTQKPDLRVDLHPVPKRPTHWYTGERIGPKDEGQRVHEFEVELEQKGPYTRNKEKRNRLAGRDWGTDGLWRGDDGRKSHRGGKRETEWVQTPGRSGGTISRGSGDCVFRLYTRKRFRTKSLPDT